MTKHRHRWVLPGQERYCRLRDASGCFAGIQCSRRATVVCADCDTARCTRHRPRTRDAQTTGRRG